MSSTRRQRCKHKCTRHLAVELELARTGGAVAKALGGEALLFRVSPVQHPHRERVLLHRLFVARLAEKRVP